MTRTRSLALALLALVVPACDPASPTTPPVAPPKRELVKSAAPSASAVESPRESPLPRKPVDEKEEPRPAPPTNPFGGGPASPPGEEKEAPPEKDPPIGKGLIPLTKDTKNLYFEKSEGGARRVHVLAEVCLREGVLEVLLCKAMTKEHESILRVDIDARLIHTALIAAGATPGSPVQFFNKKTEMEEYKPATGTKVKVTLTYHKDGKLMTVPAQHWIRDTKTKKDMAYDWVFAGSRFAKIPDRDEEYYCANNGEIISVANFVDSMMDLPIKSPRDQAELLFEIATERIPPRGTKVLVTLEPVVEKKEKK